MYEQQGLWWVMMTLTLIVSVAALVCSLSVSGKVQSGETGLVKSDANGNLVALSDADLQAAISTAVNQIIFGSNVAPTVQSGYVQSAVTLDENSKLQPVNMVIKSAAHEPTLSLVYPETTTAGVTLKLLREHFVQIGNVVWVNGNVHFDVATDTETNIKELTWSSTLPVSSPGATSTDISGRVGISGDGGQTYTELFGADGVQSSVDLVDKVQIVETDRARLTIKFAVNTSSALLAANSFEVNPQSSPPTSPPANQTAPTSDVVLSSYEGNSGSFTNKGAFNVVYQYSYVVKS